MPIPVIVCLVFYGILFFIGLNARMSFAYGYYYLAIIEVLSFGPLQWKRIELHSGIINGLLIVSAVLVDSICFVCLGWALMFVGKFLLSPIYFLFS